MEKVEEVEGIRIKGISIKDLLIPELIQEFEAKNLSINPISLVFVQEEGKDKNNMITPIILGHQNKKEVEERILHVDSPNEEHLKIISEILKSKIKEK
jgi:hypothetical protein